MFTTTLIVLLSLCVILLAREILKLKKRLEVLHKETNNRIYLTDKLGNQKLQEELERLLDIIKTNADNSDRLREQGLKELEDKIKSIIPPTNDNVIKEVQKMRDDFLALRQNF